MNNIQQLNINNLTSLWKTVSLPFNTYFEDNGVAYCHIPSSGWPNRVWGKTELTEYVLTNILNISKKNPNISSLSVFIDAEDEAYWDSSLLHAGYEEKSVQYGMSFRLKQSSGLSTRLLYKRVKSAKEITTWCTVFSRSFGYQISEDTLMNSLDRVSYYNVYFEGMAAGTILLYKTDKVAGIHSLGVVPEMRGRGIALESMHFILKEALRIGSEYATLQASGMARAMYKKLGFTEDFIMKNYQLEI